MMSLKKVMLAVSMMASFALADVGIGYDKSLAGVQGLGLNFMTEGGMVFQIIIDAENNGKTFFAVSPRFFYPLTEAGAFRPYVGIGLDYSTMKGSEANYNIEAGAEAPSNPLAEPKAPLALEIPLLFDYQIHPSVSVHTGVGVKVGLSGDTGDKNWGIRGDLVGSAGVTVWFKFSGSAALGTKQRAKKVVAPAVVADEEDEEGEEEE